MFLFFIQFKIFSITLSLCSSVFLLHLVLSDLHIWTKDKLFLFSRCPGAGRHPHGGGAGVPGHAVGAQCPPGRVAGEQGGKEAGRRILKFEIKFEISNLKFHI